MLRHIKGKLIVLLDLLGSWFDILLSDLLSDLSQKGSIYFCKLKHGAPRASPWSPITIPDYANGR